MSQYYPYPAQQTMPATVQEKPKRILTKGLATIFGNIKKEIDDRRMKEQIEEVVKERTRAEELARKIHGEAWDIKKALLTEAFYRTEMFEPDAEFPDGSGTYRWELTATESKRPVYWFLVVFYSEYRFVISKEDGLFYKFQKNEKGELEFEPISDMMPRMSMQVFVRDLRENPIRGGNPFQAFYGSSDIKFYTLPDVERWELAKMKTALWTTARTFHEPPSIAAEIEVQEQQMILPSYQQPVQMAYNTQQFVPVMQNGIMYAVPQTMQNGQIMMQPNMMQAGYQPVMATQQGVHMQQTGASVYAEHHHMQTPPQGTVHPSSAPYQPVVTTQQETHMQQMGTYVQTEEHRTQTPPQRSMQPESSPHQPVVASQPETQMQQTIHPVYPEQQPVRSAQQEKMYTMQATQVYGQEVVYPQSATVQAQTVPQMQPYTYPETEALPEERMFHNALYPPIV